MIRRSRRSWAALALAALLVHAVVAALAGASPGGRKAPADSRPAVAHRHRRATLRAAHAEGHRSVWLIDRPVATDAPFEGNVVVIEQSDGLVVVDAGGAPPAGREVVRHIRALSAKPVKAIVYTHYHGDHNLGAGALLEAWPRASVISTEATKRHMLGKPMAYIETYAESYGRGATRGPRRRTTRSRSQSAALGAFAAPGRGGGGLTRSPRTARARSRRARLARLVARSRSLPRPRHTRRRRDLAPEATLPARGHSSTDPYARRASRGRIAVLKRQNTTSPLVRGRRGATDRPRSTSNMGSRRGKLRVGPGRSEAYADSVSQVIPLSGPARDFAATTRTRSSGCRVHDDIVRNVWQESPRDSTSGRRQAFTPGKPPSHLNLAPVLPMNRGASGAPPWLSLASSAPIMGPTRIRGMLRDRSLYFHSRAPTLPLSASAIRLHSRAGASSPATIQVEEPIQPIRRPALDSAVVRLGRDLFHDGRLSRDNSVSCASCHDLGRGGADGLPHSVGIGRAVGNINAPTVLNSSLNFRQFWDGRAASLEEQVNGPIAAKPEMGSVVGRDPRQAPPRSRADATIPPALPRRHRRAQRPRRDRHLRALARDAVALRSLPARRTRRDQRERTRGLRDLQELRLRELSPGRERGRQHVPTFGVRTTTCRRQPTTPTRDGFASVTSGNARVKGRDGANRPDGSIFHDG